MYPGTFDPMTLGHEDIIARAASAFDTLWVAVAPSSAKSNALLSYDERFLLAEKVTASLPNVKLCRLSGLLVDCARAHGAKLVVRSARNGTDFDAEYQLWQMNAQLDKQLETMLFFPRLTHAGICAKLVREIWLLGGDIDAFVSPTVSEHLNKRKR